MLFRILLALMAAMLLVGAASCGHGSKTSVPQLSLPERFSPPLP